MAQRHLEQLVNAVLQASCETYQDSLEGKAEDEPSSHATARSWSEILDAASERSEQKYRTLVESPAFLRYFHEATPIEQLAQMNIGSRPAKRRQTSDISDLRAIPWVFAWTQSRVNLPGWYGLGTGLGTESPQQMSVLQEMYREWPFFRTVIDRAQLSMRRADMTIAALYAALAEPATQRAVFAEIMEEFRRAERLILEITGQAALLDNEPWLQRSINLRNPYVDPLNYIQVALLNKQRIASGEKSTATGEHEGPEEDPRWRQAILLSINGIAAGLQATG